MLTKNSTDGLNANSYNQNDGSYRPRPIFGCFLLVTGSSFPPLLAPATSVAQGNCYAYERLNYGMQTAMVAGGSEGFCVATESAVFDTPLLRQVVKTTLLNLSPSPFIETRDGLVYTVKVGCSLILKSLEHAKARRAKSCGDRWFGNELRWNPCQLNPNAKHHARSHSLVLLNRCE